MAQHLSDKIAAVEWKKALCVTKKRFENVQPWDAQEEARLRELYSQAKAYRDRSTGEARLRWRKRDRSLGYQLSQLEQ